MGKNRMLQFLKSYKVWIITFMIVVATAWVLGQLAVPTLLKIIFL